MYRIASKLEIDVTWIHSFHSWSSIKIFCYQQKSTEVVFDMEQKFL